MVSIVWENEGLEIEEFCEGQPYFFEHELVFSAASNENHI